MILAPWCELRWRGYLLALGWACWNRDIHGSVAAEYKPSQSGLYLPARPPEDEQQTSPVISSSP